MEKNKTAEKYPPELVTRIVADYEFGKTPKQISENLIAEKIATLTEREVRGKLVSMKKYRKPEKTVKSFTDEGPTKQNLLDHLTTIGFDSKAVEGLKGCTKVGLMEVINRCGGDVSEVATTQVATAA